MLIQCLTGLVALPIGALIARIGQAALRRSCLIILLLTPCLFPFFRDQGPLLANAPVSLFIVVTLFAFAPLIGCAIAFGLIGYCLARTDQSSSRE